MGQARRAHLEKQRAHEKLKKRIVSGALAAGLGTAAFVGINQLGQDKPKAAASTEALPGSENSKMPKDLQALLKKTSNEATPVDRLINLSYKELTNFQLNGRSIRVIQAGGEFEFGNPTQSQINSIKSNYEVFDKFAHSGAKIDMPVYEADEADRIISERNLQMRVTPIEKDVVLFLVPAKVDIGKYNNDIPVTFTESRGETVVSFARPDFANGGEGIMVEACQGTIDAVIANTSEYKDLKQDKFQRLTLLGQENVCNSIAKAAYMLSAGFTYEQYTQIHSKQSLGGTEQPTPGNTAFFGTMPYVGDEAVYFSLKNGIPTNIGDSFIYPPVN